MSFADTIILALTQGLTEFIPVSSSGHLLATRFLFNISDTDGTAFDAFLHLGTLLAVLLYYWKVWWGILLGVVQNDEEGKDKRELFAKIAVATVPAAVVGYFFQGVVSQALRSPVILVLSLLFTAGVLMLSDLLSRRKSSIARASFLDAAIIGSVQALALLPGVSRSGVTMAAGRWRGLSRKQATNFSFLLSAPLIAGAGLSSLSALLDHHTIPLAQLFVGFLVSFVSGIIAIYVLLKWIERISFLPFVVYLIGLAGIIFLYV